MASERAISEVNGAMNGTLYQGVDISNVAWAIALFSRQKRIFTSWRSFRCYTLPVRANCRRNVSKTWGHAGKRNCTIYTNRKLKVIVLGTPLCPPIQHCPHTVSRTAFTAQACLYSRCQHNVLTESLKINEALVRECEIIKRKAKKQERIMRQRITQTEKNKWYRQTRKLNKLIKKYTR